MASVTFHRMTISSALRQRWRTDVRLDGVSVSQDGTTVILGTGDGTAPLAADPQVTTVVVTAGADIEVPHARTNGDGTPKQFVTFALYEAGQLVQVPYRLDPGLVTFRSVVGGTFKAVIT